MIRSNAAMYILPLKPCHMDEVADIHVLSFQKSALNRLGVEAVKRYYDWQLSGPHQSICIGAFKECVMLGYCFGGRFKGAMSGFLQKNRFFLAWCVFKKPWLIVNPIFRERFKSGLNILKPGKLLRKNNRNVTENQPDIINTSKSFGILSIAVSPESQLSGIGRALMDFNEQYALQNGYTSMHLTVHPSNKAAVSFMNG